MPQTGFIQRIFDVAPEIRDAEFGIVVLDPRRFVLLNQAVVRQDFFYFVNVLCCTVNLTIVQNVTSTDNAVISLMHGENGLSGTPCCPLKR